MANSTVTPLLNLLSPFFPWLSEPDKDTWTVFLTVYVICSASRCPSIICCHFVCGQLAAAMDWQSWWRKSNPWWVKMEIMHLNHNIPSSSPVPLPTLMIVWCGVRFHFSCEIFRWSRSTTQTFFNIICWSLEVGYVHTYMTVFWVHFNKILSSLLISKLSISFTIENVPNLMEGQLWVHIIKE
jgi:hypothetical protein